MAKILISAWANMGGNKKTDSFIEGFSRTLERMGNDILMVCCNDFKYKKYISEKKTIKAVTDFNPDLIITFNNQFPVLGVLDYTSCPIACFASDSLTFFSDKDLIKKHQSRYWFFNFSNDTINQMSEVFPYVAKDRVILFGHATDLQAKNLEQDINVSFVGSIATWNRYFERYFYITGLFDEIDKVKIQQEFIKELTEFEKNTLGSFNYTLPHYKDMLSIEANAILMLTGNKRFKILSNITDLGLTVFSDETFERVMYYDLDLFKCYSQERSVSMDEATRTYNRSKISLNMPHAHACEGFSWRVCDVLASNAVLLSNPQPDLINISKGYVKLPTYESPAEAREQITKLLKDDAWRKDLSLASQKLVEDKCRFEPKFKILAQAIGGINLFNSKDDGSVLYLDSKDCSNKLKFILNNINIERKNKKRLEKVMKKGII